MEANVTHESSCKTHFLNRNRPFCGICLSRITLHCAVTELHSIHLSMPHFPVLKKRCISRTLHPFSEKTMRFEQQGAVPWKIFCSLSSSVSLALSYSHYHSFSLFSSLFLGSPHVTDGCLRKNIWRIHLGSVIYRTRQHNY